MNCEQFQQDIKTLVEDRDTICSSPDVHIHAKCCKQTACQQAWSEFEWLSAIVPVWQASLPKSHLTEGVMSRLRETSESPRLTVSSNPAAKVSDHPKHRPSAKRQVGIQPGGQDRLISIQSLTAVVCAAACLLLLIPLVRLGNIPAVEMANTDHQSPAVAVLDSDLEQIRLASTVHSYAGVPQSATEFVTDAMVLFVPADFSDSEDESPSRTEQWRGRLGEQLEPIGRELGTAVDAFLEVVSQPQHRST